MKCHAGVEFPSGKPCPKCKAELGEVCWPGINADLLELARLRAAIPSVDRIANIISDYYDEDDAGRWRKCAEHIASTFPSPNRGATE